MEFATPLISGTLVRRYKRFLADVVLSDGSTVIAHCPNTGAMTGCAEPGFRVWLRPANDPKRKLQYTWELVENDQHHLIGINSAYANNIVAEALTQKAIPELAKYTDFRREVAFGSENSKVDFLLSNDSQEHMYLEVKSLTLLENGTGYFPDTTTLRGQKHLRELMQVLDTGNESGILFCVQHTGVERVAAAEHIDPEYGNLMRQAVKKGVQVFAYGCHISEQGIRLSHRLPFIADE